MTDAQEMVVGILATSLGVAGILYCVSKLNYRIDDRYVRFRLGPIPLRKIAIEDIRDVQLGYKHWSENWTNTIYMPTIRKKAVTLYRRSGGLGRINMTPDDPAEFVEQIKSHPRFVAGQ